MPGLLRLCSTRALVGRKPEDRGRMTMAHPDVLEADVLQLAAGR